jgi:hypothetical protein
MLYAGTVLLFAGCCGQPQDPFFEVLQILILPALLYGIYKPAAASVLFFVFAVAYMVGAFGPITPDPFGPAVPDRAGFIWDIALFLALPAVAIGTLLRWKSKLISTTDQLSQNSADI